MSIKQQPLLPNCITQIIVMINNLLLKLLIQIPAIKQFNLLYNFNFSLSNMIDQYHEKLRQYYQYLFPANLICSWFGYNITKQYSKELHFRQFSFTLEIQQQQIYKRFLSYKNAQGLKEQLTIQVPIKIDIGAVMQEQPKKGVNVPKQKEFVLDIDIDDYDNVRTCCKDANICNKCWKLMRIASKILYSAMNEDFGFNDMLFVFSGRRGLHLWVCDLDARMMEDSFRRSIMDYLYLVTGNEKNDSQLNDNVIRQKEVPATKKFQKNTKLFNTPEDMTQKINIKNYYYRTQLHPFVARSLRIIQQQFRDIIQEQKILITPQRRQIIQKIIENRNKNLLARVQERWQSMKRQTSLQMYDEMIKQIQIYERFPQLYKKNQTFYEDQLQKFRPFKLLTFIQEQIQLTFMYPRLDINVSTNRNHLLKCPFSVHPKTRKVSVPFGYDMIDNFDPLKSVTLDLILSELASLQQQQFDRIKNKESQIIAKYTSLNDSVNTLETFVKTALRRLNRQFKQEDF